ncbi:MAG: biopolymer transporter ExbD [Myxococcales bacterium]|nr:biopolymer transporter ExbD [Myxococcales bacterium]
MSRNRGKIAALNLTSLMDVFTILVFFLLVNSASTEVLETPKQMTLPASVVEQKPRETVVIFVSSTEVTVQGERVALVEDILAANGQNVAAIGERLSQVSDTIIGLSTRSVANSREVTILADKSVPFNVIKKVMSTCTSEGFERISLAVIQKAPESVQG